MIKADQVVKVLGQECTIVIYVTGKESKDLERREGLDMATLSRNTMDRAITKTGHWGKGFPCYGSHIRKIMRQQFRLTTF